MVNIPKLFLKKSDPLCEDKGHIVSEKAPVRLHVFT